MQGWALFPCAYLNVRHVVVWTDSVTSKQFFLLSNPYYPHLGPLGEESQTWNTTFSLLYNHLGLCIRSLATICGKVWVTRPCSAHANYHADMSYSHIRSKHIFADGLLDENSRSHLPYHLVLVNGLSTWYVFHLSEKSVKMFKQPCSRPYSDVDPRVSLLWVCFFLQHYSTLITDEYEVKLERDRMSELYRVIYINGMFTRRFVEYVAQDSTGTLYYVYLFGMLSSLWHPMLATNLIVVLSIVSVTIPSVITVSFHPSGTVI